MSILEELDQKATEKPVIDDAVFKEAQHKALSLFTPLFKDEPELAHEVLETPISLYPSLQARRDGTGFIGTPLKCVQSFVRHTLTQVEAQHFPSYQGQVMGVWLLKRGKKESSNKEKRKAISNVLSVPERITASEDSDSLEQAIQSWSIAEHVLEGIWHHDSVQRRLRANTSLRVVYPDGFRVWCTVPDTQKQGLFFTLRSAKMWGYWNNLKPNEFVPLATDTAFPEFITLLTFAVLRFATATLTASTKTALSATLEEVFQFAHRSMSGGGVPSTSLVYDYIWRDEGKRVTNFEAQETAQSFKEAGLIDKLEAVQIESLAKRASKPSDFREWEAAKKRLEYKVSRSTSTPSVEDVVTNLSIQRTKKQVLWSSQYEAKQKQSESEEATSPERPFVQRREPLWWYDDSTD